jgi:hypothetical protein
MHSFIFYFLWVEHDCLWFYDNYSSNKILHQAWTFIMEVGMATERVINIHRQIMDVSKQIFINVSFVVFGAIRLVWQGGGHHQLLFFYTIVLP